MFSKKCVRLFLVFLVIALLFLSACRPRQYTAPEEEVKTTGDVKTDKYVVSALSGVKASSVVKGLNQEEKNELKESVIKAKGANIKFADDVVILLQLASKSKNPAVLDAALRLKKIYSVTSATDELSLLHQESTTGNYDERYDNFVFALDASVDQIGNLLTEIETEASQDSTNALLLNHLNSMTDSDGSYTELNEIVDEVVGQTEDALSLKDTDGDGTPDLVDHDVNNDGVVEITGVTEDLNNDGVITLNDVVKDNLQTIDYNEADADGDGVLNNDDLDADGDGVVDSIANGIVQETQEAIILGGVPEPNIDMGFVKISEQAKNEVAEKAKPSDTDGDGTPDYKESGESDDADGDGIENKDDKFWLDLTNSDPLKENSVQYMNYIRFVETGIAPGVVFVAPPYEVFRTMEEAKDSVDYDIRIENFAVLYKSDFENYLNEHPEIKDNMESEMQRAEFYHPEVKNDYQDFAIRNSEFGFGKELAYYYQEHAEDIRPEAFVIPDVAAHMETMKEIHTAFEKGGLSALEGKEGFAKQIYNYLSENPSAQEHFLSETGEAYNNYEQHKEQYVAEHGQEALKEQFTQIYGTDAGENYDSYFGHGGQINPDAQHAYDFGGALGAPLSSDFKFAEGFAPPPGYTGSTDGGFHAPGGETYHVGDSGSFGGVSGGISESAGGSYGPAPAGGDTGGGGGGESHPADSGGGGMHGMVVFTGWFIYSK